jgi:hypothetical protein
LVGMLPHPDKKNQPSTMKRGVRGRAMLSMSDSRKCEEAG